MSNTAKRPAGYTLIELLVTFVIFIIAITAASMSLSYMSKYFMFVKDSISLEVENKTLARLIARDVNVSSNATLRVIRDNPSEGNDLLLFKVPVMIDTDEDDIVDTPKVVMSDISWQSEVVTIGLDEDHPGELIRKQGNRHEVLAENVKKINFYDINLDNSLSYNEIKVVIDMEIESGTGRKYDITSTSIINTRNSG